MSGRVLAVERRREGRQPDWDAHAYLSAYYSRVEPTEKHTLGFLHRALSRATPRGIALDFGCGPTLHHAILLSGFAHEVHVADFQPANLDAVRRWQMGARDAHDWSPFTREAIRLGEHGDIADGARVAARESLARRSLTRILRADARKRDPLGEESRARYDVVSSFFCADSITASLAEWQSCTRNIASLLAPGGTLVIGALRRTWRWRCGGAWLPSACVDERHLQFILDAAGFDRCRQTMMVAPVPDQSINGFDSVLLAAAMAPEGENGPALR